MKPWYESAVAVAFLSAVLGFAFGLVSSLLVTWWNKKLEKAANTESLLVAFHGEISAIRGGLRSQAKTAASALDRGGALKDYTVVYLHAIFDAHVGRIGDLRDPTLAFQIAAVYSMLQMANAVGQQIAAGNLGADAFAVYVDRLVRGFDLAVYLDMRLTEQTKDIGTPDWGKVVISPQDSEDHNWAIGVLKKLSGQK